MDLVVWWTCGLEGSCGLCLSRVKLCCH